MYFALNPNPNHNYISWLILVWFFGPGEISKTKKNYIIVYIQILYKLIYFEYPTGSQIGLGIEQRPQVGEKIKYVLCPRSKPNYIFWLILVWFFGSGETSKTKKSYIIVYIQNII